MGHNFKLHTSSESSVRGLGSRICTYVVLDPYAEDFYKFAYG